MRERARRRARPQQRRARPRLGRATLRVQASATAGCRSSDPRTTSDPPPGRRRGMCATRRRVVGRMNTTTPFALRLSLAQGLFDRGDFREAALALAELVDEIEVVGRGGRDRRPTTGCCTVTDDLRLHARPGLLPLGPARPGRGDADPDHRPSRRPTPTRTCCSAAPSSAPAGTPRPRARSPSPRSSATTSARRPTAPRLGPTADLPTPPIAADAVGRTALGRPVRRVRRHCDARGVRELTKARSRRAPAFRALVVGQRARRLSRISVSRMTSSEGASGSGSMPALRRSARWFIGATTMK